MLKSFMICNICHQDKPESEFAWKIKNKGIRSKYCKNCHNTLYGRNWYVKNRQKQIERVSQRRRFAKNKIRNHILKYLKSHPCSDCGETDPVVLEFHHLHSSEKRANIGQIYGVGFSWKIVLKEINKCQVLCANCHRRKTAQEQGWYKSRI